MSGTWTQKADFSGVARYWDIGFSIGTKGYIGCGWNTSSYYKDFWEYNPDTDTWTQKANYGGSSIVGSVGFSVGSYGYVGTGSPGGGNRLDEFYQYNPDSNTWTQKTDFGGTPRMDATGFGIGSKGYIGTGDSIIAPTFNVDFWEYNPSDNTWTQKANHPGRFGAGLSSCSNFSIGTKGYLGWGRTQMGQLTDRLYEYDPDTNNWTQKADGGYFAGTLAAVGFNIGDKGYLGTGSTDASLAPSLKTFYEYNPVSNTWSTKAQFGGTARHLAVGFGIGSKGYIGTGSTGFPTSTKDFWEWEPTYTLSGTISDEFGNPIRDADITISNGTTYTTTTDENGAYSQVVNSDTYDIAVSKSHSTFNDTSESVSVTADTTKNITMPTDRMVGTVKQKAKGMSIPGGIEL